MEFEIDVNTICYNTIMLHILFGLPGSGKTYTGNIFKSYFGFHFYDGDLSLPPEMKHAIDTQQPVTEDMRNRFFAALLQEIATLKKEYPNVVVAQTYIKEKYRQQVLEKFPEAKFILIEAQDGVRESRLLTQHTYPLTLPYARAMVENFEKPHITYLTFSNNSDGENELLRQVNRLLNKA